MKQRMVLVPPRKCATCRYYLPSDTSSTGQCSHPTRQALFGLVMVRAQELACRRALNDDDWEARLPAGAAAPTRPSDHGVAPVALPASVTTPAAEEENADRLAAWSTTVPAVVAPAMSTAWARSGFQGPPVLVQAAAPLNHDTRRELNSDGTPIVRRRTSAVTEAQRAAQLRRERAKLRQHSLEPEATGSRPALGTATDPAPGDGRPPERADQPALAQRARDAGPAESAEETSGATAPQTAAAAEPAAEPELATSVADGSAHAELALSAGTEPPAPATTRPPSARTAEWAAQWRAERRAECPERRCGTCRDYRVSDNPERGWCGNPFAYAHRQLVQHDDLACLGPLGSWWAAADERWLALAGPSTAVPTPLADGLIHLLAMERRGVRR